MAAKHFCLTLFWATKEKKSLLVYFKTVLKPQKLHLVLINFEINFYYTISENFKLIE